MLRNRRMKNKIRFPQSPAAGNKQPPSSGVYLMTEIIVINLTHTSTESQQDEQALANAMTTHDYAPVRECNKQCVCNLNSFSCVFFFFFITPRNWACTWRVRIASHNEEEDSSEWCGSLKVKWRNLIRSQESVLLDKMLSYKSVSTI